MLELPRQGYGLDPRIQEIDLGQWDQLTESEARALDPDYYDRRARDKWNVPALGGEDYAWPGGNIARHAAGCSAMF